MTHIKFKGTNIDMDLDDKKMAIEKTNFLKMEKSKIMNNLIGKNKKTKIKLQYPKK